MELDSRRDVLKKVGSSFAITSGIASLGAGTAAAATGSDYDLVVDAKDGYDNAYYEIEIPKEQNGDGTPTEVHPTNYVECSSSTDSIQEKSDHFLIEGKVSQDGGSDPTGGDAWVIYDGLDWVSVYTDEVYVNTVDTGTYSKSDGSC